MATLFDPITVGNMTLPNRLVMAPMTRSRADGAGVPTAIMPEYYAQRAGAGLIISEATYVSPLGKGYERIPGIHTDAQEEAWKPVAEAVHAAGGRIFLQLFHVGRVAHPYFIGEQPVAPSAIRAAGQVFTDEGVKDFVEPRALETKEVHALVGQFSEAGQRAIRAGFDGVELHSASGYLHQQFLADGSNQRTDAYGGSPENLGRFTLETLQALTDAVGGSRVGVKLTPEIPFNDIRESNAPAVYTALLESISPLGLAYVHVGSVGATDWHALLRPQYQGLYFAGAGFDQEKGEALLASGGADAIVYGAKFLANPDLPERFRQNATLNEPDRATFYAGGPTGFQEGYTDYPKLG